MLKEQEMFLNFIKERVVSGKGPEAEAILVDAFARLSTDDFDLKGFEAVSDKLVPLIAEKYQNEVKEAMGHFAKSLKE